MLRIPSHLPGRFKVGPRSRRQHRPTGSTESHQPRRQNLESSNERRGWRRWGGKAALVAGGLLVGGVLAGTLTPGAATTTTNAANPYAATASGAAPRGAVDESKSQRPDEHLLTGDTARARSGQQPWPGTRARPCCGWR